MPGLMAVPDFVREVRDDFNSPTTSNFVSRIPQCKETVAKLEEVGTMTSTCGVIALLARLKRLAFAIKTSHPRLRLKITNHLILIQVLKSMHLLA